MNSPAPCITAVLLCLLPALASAQQATPVGRWRSIDDATGKPKALIDVHEASDGSLSARIVQVLDTRDGPNPLCTACGGKRRDQPIVGMTIAWGLKPQGASWAGGRILDPENGKEYSVKMTPTAAGRTLEVRGFLGVALLGRTQVWLREQAGPESLAPMR